MENKNVDYSKLDPDLRARLLEIEENSPAGKQLKALEKLAGVLTLLLDGVNQLSQQDLDGNEQMAELLTGVRSTLESLDSKEQPEHPDFATPVVKRLTDLEKSLTEAVKSIDVKPQVNVAAPNVDVKPQAVDLKGVERVMKGIPKAFADAIKLIPETEIPETDFSPLAERLDTVVEWLESIDHASRMKVQFPNTLKVTNVDGSVVGASTGLEATAANQVVLQNLADELSSLVNSLKFLSALQGIDSSLRTNITSGTVTTVTTLTGQTNIGGFGAQHTIMTQMNTNVATAIRANIKVT